MWTVFPLPVDYHRNFCWMFSPEIRDLVGRKDSTDQQMETNAGEKESMRVIALLPLTRRKDNINEGIGLTAHL